MFRKIIRILASIKLAVVIMIYIAVLTAVGTFVEAKYDAAAATKLVYKSWWMWVAMAALATTLIAVMVDRWPWKKRHAPFICAHIGILMIQLGFVISSTGFSLSSQGLKIFGVQILPAFEWVLIEPGLDGTMRFGIGESNRFVTTSDTDLEVWASFTGDSFTKIHSQETDFLRRSPKDHPIRIPILPMPDQSPQSPQEQKQAPAQEWVEVVDYMPYALPRRQILISDNPMLGGALRFQLQNQFANTSDWLLQRKPGASAELEFGPAMLRLGNNLVLDSSRNQIGFEIQNDGTVKYNIISKDNKYPPQKGAAKEGDSIQTPWMGMTLRLLRVFKKAEESWQFQKLERPTPLSTSAILVRFQGKEHWIQLGDIAKFFATNGVYIVTYSNRRFDIGFDLQLQKFEIGRYQGTMRAASYQSHVWNEEVGHRLISMNEPLKHRGLTFYQASFQDGPNGQPIASILSVNHDPGRALKYLGSLVLSLGTVWLFYNKRRASRAAAPKSGDQLKGSL